MDDRKSPSQPAQSKSLICNIFPWQSLIPRPIVDPNQIAAFSALLEFRAKYKGKKKTAELIQRESECTRFSCLSAELSSPDSRPLESDWS